MCVGIALYRVVYTAWSVLLVGIPNLIKLHSVHSGEGKECVGGLVHGLHLIQGVILLPSHFCIRGKPTAMAVLWWQVLLFPLQHPY